MQTAGAVQPGQVRFAVALKIVREDAAKMLRIAMIARQPLESAMLGW